MSHALELLILSQFQEIAMKINFEIKLLQERLISDILNVCVFNFQSVLVIQQIGDEGSPCISHCAGSWGYSKFTLAQPLR